MSGTTKLAVLPSVSSGATVATDTVTQIALIGPPGVAGAPGISADAFAAATADLVTTTQLTSALAAYTPASGGTGVGTIVNGGNASSSGVGNVYNGGNASSTP